MGDMFWIIIIAMALIASAFLGAAVLHGRTGETSPAAYDLQVYRDQLKEVERDLTRGTIGDGEAGRLRNEVSRRILSADTQLQTSGEDGGQPVIGSRILVGLIALFVVGGSVLYYSETGAPGYPDLGMKTRIAASDAARQALPSQAALEARLPAQPATQNASSEFLDLMEKLRTAVADNPEDLRGLALLARNEALLGNATAAHAAQAQIISVKGDAATAIDYTFYADMLISAAGGVISSEAEAALRSALERDPDQQTARYYLGLFMMQVDRPDMAFRLWEALLRNSPPDAPWVPVIRGEIEDIAARAGVKYSLPAQAELPGPGADAVSAAEDMTPEERAEMIRGMVAQLSDRLATEGGTPQEWARLITAYSVLGEMDQARAIHDEALTVFAGNAGALTIIRDAGQSAGISP